MNELTEQNAARQVVGWREIVSFPEWGIEGLRAKIDTGARTSALHVANIEELPGDRVRFEVVLGRWEGSRTVPVESPLARISKVKPSHGKRQERYVVPARIRIGQIERVIEVSLVSRKGMLCRMLVGRTALTPDLLVDPTHTYLQSGRRRRRRASRTGTPA